MLTSEKIELETSGLTDFIFWSLIFSALFIGAAIMWIVYLADNFYQWLKLKIEKLTRDWYERKR